MSQTSEDFVRCSANKNILAAAVRIVPTIKIPTESFSRNLPLYTRMGPTSLRDILTRLIDYYTGGVENQLSKNEKQVFDNVLANNFACSICLEIFKQVGYNKILSNPSGLDCKHVFCKTCIDNWTRIKQTCPMCRKRINNKAVRYEGLEKIIVEMSSTKKHQNISIKYPMERRNIKKGNSQRPPWK